MGKYEKKTPRSDSKQKKTVLIVVLIFAAVLTVAVVGVFLGMTDFWKEPETNGETANPVFNNTDEQFETHVADNTIVVQAQYVTVAYPKAFEEVVLVDTTVYDAYWALEFSADINGACLPMYYLWFNGDIGLPAGTLTDPDGNPVTVTVEFFDAPDDLTDAERETFLAAQETANDVLLSLEDNDGYAA